MRFSSALVPIASVAALAAVAGNILAADAYPSRPIRIIVPFPPGGSTDPMARLVAAKLSERWNDATIVVDNRPGGNTIIGNSIVVKAAPDGYTMGWCGTSLLTTPHLIPNMPYDVAKDLVGVTTVARSRMVLVVHPSMPVKTLKELIAMAKAKPGELNFGSSGIGTTTHLSAELFKTMAGVDMQHIPYKGSGPLTTDLLGGRLNLSFQVAITQIPNIRSGKLRPIAITGEGRAPALPDVPSFAEAGLPGYGLTSWSCLIAPTGTPMEIRRKIANEMAVVLKSKATLDLLAKQGMEPVISTPEQTDALIKEDSERYRKIIKQANITWRP